MRRVFVLCVSAAFAAAGCSHGNASGAEEPPIVELSVDDVGNLAFPLDPYLDAGGPDFATQSQAYLIVFNQCMSRFGFKLEEPVPEMHVLALGNERHYGLTDLSHARQYGYGVPSLDREPDERSAIEQTDAFAAIAAGDTGDRFHNGVEIPLGGCSGEAARTVDEGAPRVEDPSLGQRLAADAYHLAEQDSRVVAAFHAWSDCMARAGYDYASPWQSNDDPAFSGPQASPIEIAVATADVTCKWETGLVDIWAGVEFAYQLRLIDENADALEDVRKLVEVRNRNAVEIVNG